MTAAEKREALASLRYGPYLTPVVAVGVIVECEARGLVTVVGISDGPIPWPVGERDGQQQLIVFKALARAVRQESPRAVAAAWGVSMLAVEQWRQICRQPRRRKKQTLTTPPIPWKHEDDELIRRLTLAEAARFTGRTLTAVRKRRRALGLPDGRTAAQRAVRNKNDLTNHAAAISRTVRQRTIELEKSIAELDQTHRRVRVALAYWKSRKVVGPRWRIDQ
jgi:hypothetical protein